MNGKLGFIGLGIMGLPMAKNLMKAGFDLVVFDIMDKPVQEMVLLGAEKAADPADVASKATVIVTMLPDGPDVEAVVLGKRGLIETATVDTVVIDMSSISPTIAKRIAASLSKKGAAMLDAPVSGGEPGAISGQLAIMVGGPADVFEKSLPIFNAVGKSAVLVGETGAGQTTKLVNQILVGIHIAAMGEAFLLASKAGVDPMKVYDAIKGGLAGSNVLNAKIPLVLARNFKPGFKMKLHKKDLKNALEAAETLGLDLPLTQSVQNMLTRLIEAGKGEEDHSGIVQALETANGTEIKAAT